MGQPGQQELRVLQLGELQCGGKMRYLPRLTVLPGLFLAEALKSPTGACIPPAWHVSEPTQTVCPYLELGWCVQVHTAVAF